MAASLNKVQLIGHLGRDPETRSLNSGASIVSFSIATSESWRDKATNERKERTEWHNIVIFNENIGKVADQYLKKGSKVYIEGQMRTREYTYKDGVTRRATEVVLAQFQGQLVLLDRAERSAPDENSYGTTRQKPETGRPASKPPTSMKDTLDDDIPF